MQNYNVKLKINNCLKKAHPLLDTISDTPDLDAEILLSFVLNKPKEYLYANPDQELTSGQIKRFNELLARRKKHEPIAYIIKKKEFFGLEFFVDKRVLIPRPETEILVEEVLSELRIMNYELRVVDIGTGSGCMAVSLAKNLTDAKIFATDISKKALQVAKINIKKHNVGEKIKLFYGDLLKPLKKEKVDVIVANLPYLTVEQLNLTEKDVREYEPKTALVVKEETELYLKLLDQAPNYLNKNGMIFLEIDPVFKDKMIKLVKNKLPKAKFEIKNDLGGCERIMMIKILN